MSSNSLPELPQYESLRGMLETERKAIIQVNSFSKEDDDYVRSEEDAGIILNFIKEIQENLWNFFNEYPSLVSFFNSEYLPFQEFIQRSKILELIFLDDCLIPEKEAFFYGQDGGINPTVLEIHKKSFQTWIDDKKKKHVDTQALIRENFSLEVKTNNLECQCTNCSTDYRSRLRDYVYDECVSIVEKRKTQIEENIKNGIVIVSEHFRDMQKELDKMFFKVRYRLKRSSLNRLESQIKSLVRDNFNYPSNIANAYVNEIEHLFKEELRKEELPEELITQEEYARFYSQLSSGLWRSEKNLLREFQKLVKSVVVLKKKDVSSKILQEYLGEFWIHSSARQLKRKIIYHMGPTNSGKTYHAIEALCKAKTGSYLAPLRLLAAELYDTMNHKGVMTSLLTGEEVVDVEGATHYSSTIEMAKLSQAFDCVVIDEIQMITDPQRGWAWTRALVNVMCPEIHICGDASVLDLIKEIVELCGDTLEVNEYQRMTTLEVEKRTLDLKDLQKSDALIVFSRRNALRYKYSLEQLGFKVSIVYGMLSPEVRREQARKFDKGLTDIMVSTDAIAMGMNLPIRRIVFSTLTKFINSQEYPISQSEIKQIAGRAGRFQRFPNGFVSCLHKVEAGLEDIHDALTATLDQKEQCMVGPDLDIYSQVNNALQKNGLPGLKLSEFLRLFNTMTFKKPFFCVELKEMIEIAEMVEDADPNGVLSIAEIFGYACAPVNLGLLEHVQYFLWILNNYVKGMPIKNESVDFESNDIDYLETSIKCVELYQWLSRHFNRKHFEYDEEQLLENKTKAIEKLNYLLSDKITPEREGPFGRRRDSGRRNGPREGGGYNREGSSHGGGSGPKRYSSGTNRGRPGASDGSAFSKRKKTKKRNFSGKKSFKR